MGKLTDLKCRDCMRAHPMGWWEQPTCEISGLPVDEDGPACISILPKDPEKAGKCLTTK